MKKMLYQFMRQQVTQSKGTQGEVYKLRPRQKMRRGPLPNLTLQALAEQGVRYLILIHFANFITVYYINIQGTIINVKNYDRSLYYK